MIRRPFHAFAVLSLALFPAGCQEPTAVARDAVSAQAGRSPTVSRAEPGCIFNFHARLAPESVPGPGLSARLGGRIHFRLVGDGEGGEEEGEMEYGGLARLLPEIDPGEYRALLVRLLRRIPQHTPEWTDHQQGDPGRTLVGRHLHFRGGAPVPEGLAAELALHPSLFDAEVVVETDGGSASYTGRLRPERGSSSTIREDAIRGCFGG
ncbi:MAG TPA: hypothetical protein VLL48_07685 [Longimicrobiales bacterium]|nr:hypothetical protein [Longimicrobiales bacterium]